jgi:hypothetical protein
MDANPLDNIRHTAPDRAGVFITRADGGASKQEGCKAARMSGLAIPFSSEA